MAERGRERVTVLSRDRLWKCLMKFRCVNSWIMFLKLVMRRVVEIKYVFMLQG